VTRHALNGRFFPFAGSGTDLRGDTWGRPPDVDPAAAGGAISRPGDARTGRTAGQIMTTDVRSCRETDTLASAALAMYRGDCRFLPVVDGEGHPIGVLTDGDVCLLGATDHRRLRDIFVSEAMNRPVVTCRPEQDIRDVLSLMRSRGIRHVPVVGPEGVLVGVLSLTDLVLCAEESHSHGDSLCREIATALREIAQKNAPKRAVRVTRFSAD
jgi:CBS domain-containing protein